jgi:hypothetical protein
VSAQRTVTVPTIDHGDVTIPCPAWCVGHGGQRPEYRSDISHTGPEQHLGPAGRPLLVALLTQHPFSSGAQEIGLHVDPVDFTSTYSPAELDQLAAGLVEAAAQLRHQARWLAVLRGGAQ